MSAIVRRNIIPNPQPVGTTGWAATESNATRVAFNNTGSALHYKATATAAGCQAGILWNDPSQIAVRAGENYGLTLKADILSRPAVGAVQAVVLWKGADGVTPVASWFSNSMLAGLTHVREIVTAPAGAYHASVALLYLTSGAVTPDTVTPFEWSVSEVLLEPLGPPPAADPAAIVNHVANPSLEYGDDFWYPHNHNADALPGSTWEIQTGGLTDAKSMRHTITATSGIIPGTTFYGFIGSYVGSLYSVEPGDVLEWRCDTNVLAGPTSGPGIFLEIFFYYYDGDPAHTVMVQHTNGESIDQPLVLDEEQTLTMVATCPEGANAAQVTVVMASGEPDALLDFHAGRGMLTINQSPIDHFFDGDSFEAGWDGLPGKSISRDPGRSARVPGSWFSGDTFGAQWEGSSQQSMSTLNAPMLRSRAEPTLQAMQLISATTHPV